MKEAVFLTLEECLRLHEELIRRFGGSAGIRDPGLLESALARPRSGYYQTLFQQAAALMQSLAMNHCFIDGNKRMAMGCAFIFLDWNGLEINVNGEDAERFLLENVIIGKADVAEIAGWLEAYAGPHSQSALSQSGPDNSPSPSSAKKTSAESLERPGSRKPKTAAAGKKSRRGRPGKGKA